MKIPHFISLNSAPWVILWNWCDSFQIIFQAYKQIDEVLTICINTYFSFPSFFLSQNGIILYDFATCKIYSWLWMQLNFALPHSFQQLPGIFLLMGIHIIYNTTNYATIRTMCLCVSVCVSLYNIFRPKKLYHFIPSSTMCLCSPLFSNSR